MALKRRVNKLKAIGIDYEFAAPSSASTPVSDLRLLRAVSLEVWLHSNIRLFLRIIRRSPLLRKRPRMT